jgi:hypothetical protein
VSNEITIWKDDTTSDHTWYVEVGGEAFCEIARQCEQWARGGIRARGTKVEGYRVSFDDGRVSVFFNVTWFKCARSALKAATGFARSEAAKGGRA